MSPDDTPAEGLLGLLERLELTRLAPVFAEHEIDRATLLRLDAADLRELGIRLGPRRVLLDEIRRLTAPRAPGADDSAAGGATVPPRGGTPRELRRLTVLFCDLVGSTELATRLDPDELHSLVQDYFGVALATARRFGGYVSNLEGDAVVILFGYPHAGEETAEKAVAAGLALVDEIGARAPGSVDGVGIELRARVGIASGTVMISRSDNEFLQNEIHTVGRAPFLASRLQGLAAPGEVVIDEGTRALVRGLFRFEPRAPAELKGFAQKVVAVRVRAVESGIDRFDATRGRVVPLVGRDVELAALLHRWRALGAGGGGACLVCGAPGVGKSRLVRELRRAVVAGGGRCVSLQCSPLYERTPLRPVIDLLETRIGGRGTGTDGARLQALEAELRGGDDPLRVPLVAGLLQLEVVESPSAAALSPPEAQERLLGCLSSHLAALAGERGLIDVEDVHWVDPSTRALLRRVASAATDARRLLVLTGREEARGRWREAGPVDVMELGPLGMQARAELIDHLTPGPALPDAERRALAEASDGNPLYLEALLEGSSRDTGPAAGVRPGAPGLVPDSLYRSVIGRLECLDRVRPVAEAASVVGRRFDDEVLRALFPSEPERLSEALETLRRLGIVEGSAEGTGHAFRHALLRDVVYESIVASRRRALHSATADALARLDPHLGEAGSEVLAWHLSSARRPAEAAPLWFRAGARAAAGNALLEARYLLEQCLAACTASGAGPAALELDALTQLLGIERAIRGVLAPTVGTLSERLLAAAREHASPQHELDALNGLYSYHLVGSRNREAERWANELGEAARRHGDATCEMIGLKASGAVALHLGDAARATACLEDSLGRYREAEHAPLAVTWGSDHAQICACFLALARFVAGDPVAAWRHSRFAVEHGEKLDHLHSVAQSLAFRSVLGAMADEHALALASGERARNLGARHGIRYIEVAGAFFAELARARGAAVPDTAALEAAFDAYGGSGNFNYAPISHALLAEHHVERGAAVPANECLARAFELQEASGERWTESELYRVRGRLAALRGENDRAVDDWREALRIARARRMPGLALKAALQWAEAVGDVDVDARAGAKSGAADALEGALSAMRSLDGGALVGRALRLCGRAPRSAKRTAGRATERADRNAPR